jgi:hypothetical protein
MNGWVKTSERLPEPNQTVWFYVPSLDMPQYHNPAMWSIYDGIEYGNIAIGNDGYYFAQDGHGEYNAYFDLEKVTHWMPYVKPEKPADVLSPEELAAYINSVKEL